MAYTIQESYDVGSAAQRVVSAAAARTLTNNPAATLEANLEAAVADFDTIAGTALQASQAVVTNGDVVVIGETQYAFTVTDGVITGVVVDS